MRNTYAILLSALFLLSLAWAGCSGTKEQAPDKGIAAEGETEKDEEKKVEQRKAEPRKAEPRKAEPKREEPKKVESADQVTRTLDGEDIERAPDKFAVELDTTKGKIVIDVTRSWAPQGADRFHELVNAGFYKDVAFFRVIEGFMAQVGIHGDPEMNRKWRSKRIKDDQVRESNTEGMVTFATSGRNSRTTQFFINFKDNGNLDRMGFSPFGKVRDMAVVNELYSGYGEGAPRGNGPNQKSMQLQGNVYLKKEFPKLDYIKSAKILEE